MIKSFFTTLLFAAGLFGFMEMLAPAKAQSSAPCQWNYGFVNGVATATYCGNISGANIQQNMLSYGADPSGNADVCVSALPNALAAITAAGGGALYFPHGTYKFATCQLASSSVPIRIYGDGAGISNLNFSNAGAGLAGINLTNEGPNAAQVMLDDFSINTTVSQTNGNAAIAIAGTFAANSIGPRINNISINTVESGTYWTYGFKCTACGYGRIDNVVILGNSGNSATQPTVSNDMTAGLYLIGQSNALVATGLVVQFGEYGYYVNDDEEGFNCTGCQFVANTYGAYHGTGSTDLSTGEQIINSYFTNWVAGEYYAAANNPSIIATRFDKYPGSAQNWIGVQLADGTSNVGSNTAIVHSNFFIGYSLPAPSVTAGITCTIEYVGSTNWTAIGAASNTIGVKFTATGTGTGTGGCTTTAGGSAIPVTLGTHALWDDISLNKAFEIDYFIDEGSGTQLGISVKNNTINDASTVRGFLTNSNPYSTIEGNLPGNVGQDAGNGSFGLNATQENVGGSPQQGFLTQCSSSCSITALLGGHVNQVLTVICNDTNTTLVDNASQAFANGSNYTCARVGATLTLRLTDIWREIGRAS